MDHSGVLNGPGTALNLQNSVQPPTIVRINRNGLGSSIISIDGPCSKSPRKATEQSLADSPQLPAANALSGVSYAFCHPCQKSIRRDCMVEHVAICHLQNYQPYVCAQNDYSCATFQDIQQHVYNCGGSPSGHMIVHKPHAASDFMMRLVLEINLNPDLMNSIQQTFNIRGLKALEQLCAVQTPASISTATASASVIPIPNGSSSLGQNCPGINSFLEGLIESTSDVNINDGPTYSNSAPNNFLNNSCTENGVADGEVPPSHYSMINQDLDPLMDCRIPSSAATTEAPYSVSGRLKDIIDDITSSVSRRSASQAVSSVSTNNGRALNGIPPKSTPSKMRSNARPRKRKPVRARSRGRPRIPPKKAKITNTSTQELLSPSGLGEASVIKSQLKLTSFSPESWKRNSLAGQSSPRKRINSLMATTGNLNGSVGSGPPHFLGRQSCDDVLQVALTRVSVESDMGAPHPSSSILGDSFVTPTISPNDSHGDLDNLPLSIRKSARTHTLSTRLRDPDNIFVETKRITASRRSSSSIGSSPMTRSRRPGPVLPKDEPEPEMEQLFMFLNNQVSEAVSVVDDPLFSEVPRSRTPLPVPSGPCSVCQENVTSKFGQQQHIIREHLFNTIKEGEIPIHIKERARECFETYFAQPCLELSEINASQEDRPSSTAITGNFLESCKKELIDLLGAEWVDHSCDAADINYLEWFEDKFLNDAETTPGADRVGYECKFCASGIASVPLKAIFDHLGNHGYRVGICPICLDHKFSTLQCFINHAEKLHVLEQNGATSLTKEDVAEWNLWHIRKLCTGFPETFSSSPVKN